MHKRRRYLTKIDPRFDAMVEQRKIRMVMEKKKRLVYFERKNESSVDSDDLSPEIESNIMRGVRIS